jgi:hypothetical protein
MWVHRDVDKEIRGEFTLLGRDRHCAVNNDVTNGPLAFVLDTALARLPENSGVVQHGSLYKVSQAGQHWVFPQRLRSADCVVLGDDAVTRRA